MLRAPLIESRAISGIVISASGSSAGVPATVATRGSRCAWLTRTGSRYSTPQPVSPTPKGHVPARILSAHLSRAHTGWRSASTDRRDRSSVESGEQLPQDLNAPFRAETQHLRVSAVSYPPVEGIAEECRKRPRPDPPRTSCRHG